MKSGLEGRNNTNAGQRGIINSLVSMKSGLEGRNNHHGRQFLPDHGGVSMKSGLEGRNNLAKLLTSPYNVIVSQ